MDLSMLSPGLSQDFCCTNSSSIYTIIYDLIQKRINDLGDLSTVTSNYSYYTRILHSSSPNSAFMNQNSSESIYSETPQKFFAMLAAWTTLLSFAGVFYGKLFISKSTRKLLLNVKTLVEDVILFAITIGWLLVAACPYGLLLFWRLAMHFYIKLRYGSLSNLVAGLDSMAILDSDNSKQIIKSIKVLEGQIDLEEFRRRVLKTVTRVHPHNGKLVYPKFHQYLQKVGGFFAWLPSNFDIKYHVRFLDGCNEDSPSISESEALRILSGISNDSFETRKAPWEILIVPNYHYDCEGGGGHPDNPKKSAIIIRIHHGIGDGYSLMKLILRDMSDHEEKVEIPQAKRENRSIFYSIAVFFYIILKSPRSFYREMWINDQNPLHNQKIKITGKKSILWSDPIDVSFLKDTKNKMGYGMNSMLLSSLAGSVTKYIQEEYKANDSKASSLSALLPYPAPNHPDNAMVNKFSIVILPLNPKYEEPLERSKAIFNQVKIMSQSPDAILNLFLMNLCGVMPVWFSRVFIINKQSTIVISNIPGPSKGISIWGKKLLDTMFWLPHLGDSGVSVSFLSYTNHLRIGITVDSGVIQDGEVGARRLLDGIVDELFKMANALNIPSEGVVRHLVKTKEEIVQSIIEEEVEEAEIERITPEEDKESIHSNNSEEEGKENVLIRKEPELIIKNTKRRNKPRKMNYIQNSVKSLKLKVMGNQEIMTR